MESLALFFSARGRLAPRAFAAGAAAVYGTAFLSQLLISAPVMLHAGLAPFALVQAIAVLYALAVILFLLLVALIIPPGDAAQPASAGNVLALYLLMTTLMADPGLFAYVAVGIFALVVAPVPMAIALSIWAATRPAATSAARP